MNLWQFALKTLLADRGKLATALLGVSFCVVLVNIQGGLFLGLIHKATILVDHGSADIWVGHQQMHCVDLSMDIPRDWEHRLRSVPGVADVEPYLIGFANMTLPNGSYEGVALIGVARHDLIGADRKYGAGDDASLQLSHGVVVDQWEDHKLLSPQVGDLREIGGNRARIVAKSQGITNFLVAPYAFTTFERACRYLGRSPAMCSYLLVQVEAGADAGDVCQRIRKQVPQLDALTREQFSRTSANFWLTRTGMGISFGLATMLGLGVGIVTVAQTLHALALDRRGEYATLRAMGASRMQIGAVLLSQSAVIGISGAVLGLALVAAITLVCSTPIAPIEIPAWLSLGSTALLLAICLIAGCVPLLELMRGDAAITFYS